MPAQIRGDAKASNAEGAEFSLGSCTGLGNPQMLVEHLFQEKLDANMNVKPCEMISQTFLQICTDPAPPCAALCSTSVCCMLLNAHTALSGGEFFKGEWVCSTKSSPAEHHQIITTLDNQSTDFVLSMFLYRLHFKALNVCVGKADNSFCSSCLVTLHRPCLKDLF